MCPWFSAVLAAALVVVSPTLARAQLYENIGTRAQGMSGAFVAVADDATSTWWNPAGIATGALFNLVFEKGRVTQPETPKDLAPARRSSASGFAMAYPALGLSYYRLRVSQIAPIAPIGPPAQNRQELGGEDRHVRSLAASQFGVTVGQSLGDHLVLASTLKVMRGGVASAVVDGSTDPLDLGDDLELASQTHGDLDVGAMVAFTHARVGLTVRNLRQPEFGEGNDRLVLKRQARAGFAILATPNGALEGLTVSGDADLTRTATVFGDVRHVATGVEAWFMKRRLGVRGGLAANTVGERRATSSAGVSIAATSAFYIEVAQTFGSDGSIRGWSSTVRVTF